MPQNKLEDREKAKKSSISEVLEALSSDKKGLTSKETEKTP